MLTRRGFFFGMGATLAVARSGILMPVKDRNVYTIAYTIERVKVSARSRVLKATYTREIPQPLEHWVSEDAVEELGRIIQKEIDRNVFMWGEHFLIDNPPNSGSVAFASAQGENAEFVGPFSRSHPSLTQDFHK